MRMNGFGLARPWWLLPPGRLHPAWWLGVGVALIALDYLAGISTQFPLLFTIPVIVAAWYSGRRPAMALAIAVSLAHIIFLAALWMPASGLAAPIATTIFRGSVVLVIGVWFARLSEHERNLHRYVRSLEGLLVRCTVRRQQLAEAAFIPVQRQAENDPVPLDPGTGKGRRIVAEVETLSAPYGTRFRVVSGEVRVVAIELPGAVG